MIIHTMIPCGIVNEINYVCLINTKLSIMHAYTVMAKNIGTLCKYNQRRLEKIYLHC